ncbi:MAG: hypothetical protein HOC23_00625 [Halieaceae bacterium]|jgi:hypothetical protein|nr:hypothetical protein [Halieaceae bacterium]
MPSQSFSRLTSRYPSIKRLGILATFLMAVLLVTGCKVHIIVPVGGKVISQSGTYECTSGQLCEIDVSDTSFDETFVAQADPEFEFLGWRLRENGFCGKKGTAPCRLFTTAFANYDTLMQFLQADDDVYYLEPIFARQDEMLVVSGYSLEAGREDAVLTLELTLPSTSILSLPYLFTGVEDEVSVSITFNGAPLTALVGEPIDWGSTT